MSRKKVYLTDKAPAPVGPYSQAVRVGDLLFCSGQIAIDPSNGELTKDNLIEETKLVMSNISAVLESAGLSLKDIVKTTIFLTNMDDFAQFNEVYASYFSDHPPARSCVEASRLPKGVSVEIETIAHFDQ